MQSTVPAISRGFAIYHTVWTKMSELQKYAYSGKSLRYLRGKSTRYRVVLGKKPSKNCGFRNAVVGRWLFEARRWGWLTRLQRRVRRRWWVNPLTAQSQEKMVSSTAYSAESGEDGEFTRLQRRFRRRWWVPRLQCRVRKRWWVQSLTAQSQGKMVSSPAYSAVSGEEWWVHPLTAQSQEKMGSSPAYSAESGKDGDFNRLQRRVRRRWWVHPPTAQIQEKMVSSPTYCAESGKDGEFNRLQHRVRGR